MKNEQCKSISRNSRLAGVSFLLFSGPSFRVSLHGKRYGKVYESTVNSLIATTSRKRPPPVSDHFVNIRFCLSVKYCFKNSLVNHYLNFLNDCDHFLVQKFDVFFCFLFPVSDHPTGSLIIVTKTMARIAQKFSFISFFLNTADQACWQIITVDLQLVITKGYRVRATTIEGQNTFAPLLLCFA